MSLWGASDAASNAVKHSIVSNSPKTGANLYANVTLSAVVTDARVGVYGTSTAEVQAKRTITAPGWVKVTQFSGPVTSVTVSAGGSGYANSDLVVVSSTGTVNAAGTLVTNSTGGITSITITSGGRGFVNASTVAITNSTGGATAGSGATLVGVLGGRANRIQYETLVVQSAGTGTGSTTP